MRWGVLPTGHQQPQEQEQEDRHRSRCMPTPTWPTQHTRTGASAYLATLQQESRTTEEESPVLQPALKRHIQAPYLLHCGPEWSGWANALSLKTS